MTKLIVILFVALTPVFAGSLRSDIETKLKAGDFPTGLTSPEYSADKEPHLVDLLEKASENKEENLIPAMKQIAANKRIFWEVRQDAIQYLAYFSTRKDIKIILRKISKDKSEALEIREAAKSGL